jgi:hypothetical protein
MAAAKSAKAPPKTAGISDAAVRAKTGKTWAQWCNVLDKAGAKKMSHKEIATYVHDVLHLPPWWSQMVTVGYEQARGLREKHQTTAGYQMSASKTFTEAAATVFEAWVDAKTRNRWLPQAPLTIRKATPHKSLRISWDDGKNSVDVMFYPKGDAKCQIAVDHRKLKDARDVARLKKYWAEALHRLQKMLAG